MIPTNRFVFRFSNIEVHEHELKATRAGQALDLEPKAFRVLIYLVKHAGHLVSKSELIEAVWGETAVTDNSLTRVIALLRRALDDDPRQPRFIETVSTAGYRFICPVETAGEVSTDPAKAQSPDSAAHGDSPSLSGSAEASTDVLFSVNEKAAVESGPPTRLNSKAARRGIWLAIGIFVTVAIAAAAWWLFTPRQQPRVTNITQITNDGVPKIFVTDGSRIFYGTQTKDGDRFYQLSANGGEPLPMGDLDGMFPLDISPDRSELLLRRGKDSTLWVASVLGGAPRRLGDLIASEARWSPSGTQIAYPGPNSILVAQSDGSQSRTLEKEVGGFGLTWSPDGRKIRFSNWTEAGASIWEISQDGTGLHRLSFNGANYSQFWHGSWTPDQRYFVFMANDVARPYHWDVWTVREGGGLWGSSRITPVRLTNGPLRVNEPKISPDGKRIFFYGMLDRVELVRYDPSTKQWASYLSGLSAWQLDFSRDGKSLAYVSYPENYLLRRDTDGGHKLQLMPPPFQGVNPRFSPDSTQIAFSGSRPGEPSRAYVETAEGGGLRKLTDGECGRDGEGDPIWSPDGASIVFACDPEGPNAGLNRESTVLRIIDLKTGQISILPGSQGLWSPRWSPDGRYLIALSFPLPADLVLYDMQTHTQQKLLTPKDGGWQAWSRDGQYAYFMEEDAECRVRISDGHVEPVADFTSLKWADVSVHPSWAGITPDGSVIAIRNTGSAEIYALDWVAP